MTNRLVQRVELTGSTLTLLSPARGEGEITHCLPRLYGYFNRRPGKWCHSDPNIPQSRVCTGCPLFVFLVLFWFLLFSGSGSPGGPDNRPLFLPVSLLLIRTITALVLSLRAARAFVG